jgi:lipoprotein-releasing system permease protein
LLKLDVGEKVLIYFVQDPPRYRNLEVVGIYETHLEEFDKKMIIGDLDLIRRINDWKSNEVAGVEVFIDNENDIFDAQELLFDALPIDLYVESVEENYLQFFDWFNMIYRNVVILLVLILLVACFSMVSILLILIMERTQMVGLLKSMGADNQLIRRIFVSTGLRLIGKGFLYGNGLAFGLAIAQYYFHFLPLDAVNYYIDYVPIEFSWSILLGVNLLTAIVISLSLFIPVTIINRIQPVKAIRFD